jgi:hypothetical protein
MAVWVIRIPWRLGAPWAGCCQGCVVRALPTRAADALGVVATLDGVCGGPGVEEATKAAYAAVEGWGSRRETRAVLG